MSKPQPAPATEGAARASQLEDVSNRLAEMITSLRRSAENIHSRRLEHATPPPAGYSARPPAPADPAADAPWSREELGRLRASEAALRERLDEIEAANRAVGDELVVVQEQIAHAAGLSVVLRRLHEAGTRAEVADGLVEAVVNVVGCEDLVLLLAGPGGALVPARVIGRSVQQAAALAADPAVIAAALGAPRLGPAAAAVAPDLTALVPLAGRGRQVGLLALCRLLPQKPRLGPLDAEVLELLHLHGALAWLAAPEAPADGA